jgi:hypothetical protein
MPSPRPRHCCLSGGGRMLAGLAAGTPMYCTRGDSLMRVLGRGDGMGALPAHGEYGGRGHGHGGIGRLGLLQRLALQLRREVPDATELVSSARLKPIQFLGTQVLDYTVATTWKHLGNYSCTAASNNAARARNPACSQTPPSSTICCISSCGGRMAALGNSPVALTWP